MTTLAERMLSPVAAIGRPVVRGLESLTQITRLLLETLYFIVVGPFTGKTRFRQLVFPLMQQIGVRSLFITCLVSILVGGILVINTADQFKKYGVINFVPTMICLAVVRELGPLMTAIVLAGRVGAAFTAGLGSMVINEEVLALKTMGINPVGYLVAPRFIAICVMLPCLTIFSYLIGNIGGLIAGTTLYDIGFWSYIDNARNAFELVEIAGGLVKAFVFGAVICLISCQNAFSVRGGPEGVGRNTMISVVMCLVMIIVADAIITMIMAPLY
ncbi:MAG: ABC transporter permease [Planctomycetes bacterium]|nr:ABC transporter permease [Planctomycetota bacterium]